MNLIVSKRCVTWILLRGVAAEPLLIQILEEIHGRFYQSYDSRDRSITFTPGPEPDANVLYDIRVS